MLFYHKLIEFSGLTPICCKILLSQFTHFFRQYFRAERLAPPILLLLERMNIYLWMSSWYLFTSSMIFGLARRSFSWVKKWANLVKINQVHLSQYITRYIHLLAFWVPGTPSSTLSPPHSDDQRSQTLKIINRSFSAQCWSVLCFCQSCVFSTKKFNQKRRRYFCSN